MLRPKNRRVSENQVLVSALPSRVQQEGLSELLGEIDFMREVTPGTLMGYEFGVATAEVHGRWQGGNFVPERFSGYVGNAFMSSHGGCGLIYRPANRKSKLERRIAYESKSGLWAASRGVAVPYGGVQSLLVPG